MHSTYIKRKKGKKESSTERENSVWKEKQQNLFEKVQKIARIVYKG